MARQAPGQHRRQGLTLKQVIRKFATEAKAEAWFVSQRWPEGIRCPRCGTDNVNTKIKHKTMPYKCRPCRKEFSVKTLTPMEASKIALSDWAIGLYLYSTSLKGVSSMKLHRELGITQKAAWHMAHRIREMFDMGIGRFEGPVEADETYIGGSETNRPEYKRSGERGTGNKTAVAGIKDRASGLITTQVIDTPNKATLQGFVHSHTEPDATVYTDEHSGYVGMRRRHEQVRHAANEYVRGEAHTQNLDGFWSHVKRGIDGVYHWWSVKHIDRYMAEFEGRYNLRPMDTIDMMGALVSQGVGKRLRYKDLIGPKHTRQSRMM